MRQQCAKGCSEADSRPDLKLGVKREAEEVPRGASPV